MDPDEGTSLIPNMFKQGNSKQFIGRAVAGMNDVKGAGAESLDLDEMEWEICTCVCVCVRV